MIANRIWILIGKKVSGEATQQELNELQILVAESGDDINTLTGLEQIWSTVNIETVHKSQEEVDRRWDNFKQKIQPEATVIPLKRSNRRSYVWMAAASILLLFAVTLSLLTNNNPETGSALLTTVVAPKNDPIKLVLPDGSKVWLNAKSKLIYKKQFTGKLREVRLIGEAYFDVVKDSKHPFVVNTSAMHLRVLGTAFNVRAFPNERKSEAALVHGSIEVTLVNNPEKKTILKPTEKITVRNDKVEGLASSSNRIAEKAKIASIPLINVSNIHYKDEDPLPVETQWIEKKLVFESETFEDLALRMERYYDVKINFNDESVKSVVLSGAFKDENMVMAMTYLRDASVVPFNFKFESDKKITIYR